MEKKIADEKMAAEAKVAAEKAELERTIAAQRAAGDQKAAEERAAAEKAHAEAQARMEAQVRASEEALKAEKLRLQEELARERAELEKSLAEERAEAEKKRLALEAAQAQEKALSEQKAMAEQRAREQELALARERELARQRHLEQQKALADERELMAAKERALAEEREREKIAQQQALEQAKADERARIEEEKKQADRRVIPVIQIVHPGSANQEEAGTRPTTPQRRSDPPAEKRNVPSPASKPAPAMDPVKAALLAAERMDDKPPAPTKTSPPDQAQAETGNSKPLSKAKPPKAPKPTKVPKRSNVPKGSSTSRRQVLIPLFIVLLLILGAGGTVIYLASQMGREGSGPQPKLSAAEEARLREVKYLQTGWQVDARQVLSQFLAAETAAGKAAFSIEGSGLLAEMQKFYKGGLIDDSDTPISGFFADPLPMDDMKRGIFRMRFDQPPQFEMRDFFRPLAPLEVQFGIEEPDLLLSSLAKAGNFASEAVKVHVFFKRGNDGLRIDWETFVQTKYRTFRDFTELARPGESRVFRVFILEDVPEQGKMQAGMRTYRLADPAHKTDMVRVAVAIDSDLGRSLSLLNWRGIANARPKIKTATVELEWTDQVVPELRLKKFICWEFLGIGGQAVAPSPKGSGK